MTTETVRIFPGTPHGYLFLPPSKSILHRRLIGAALAGGKSRILGRSDSADIQTTIRVLQTLGAAVEPFFESYFVRGIPALFLPVPVGEAPADPETIEEEKTPASAKLPDSEKETAASAELPEPEKQSKPNPTLHIACGDSASTLRFLLPLCAALGAETHFTVSERLRERGIRVYEELFADPAYGVTLEAEADGYTLRGRLQPADYRIRGSESSQYLSGLFFALPLLDGDSTVQLSDRLESAPYAEMTQRLLAEQGIRILRESEDAWRIPGGQRAVSGNYPVEADWSLASPFAVMNALGAQIKMKGLSEPSLQGDACLPGRIASLLTDPEEPIDLTDCPDLGPALFALAAARGEGHFVGIRRLRLKESDRVGAMCAELEKFGASCFIGADQVDIFSNGLESPCSVLEGHGDHRVVMALAALAVWTGGTIQGAQAVEKSYPAFFRDLAALKIHVEEV